MKECVKKVLIKLGKHINKIREKKSISLSEISEKTGIRKSYLQKIEEGSAYGVLIERHLIKIANTLNITLKELLDFENK